SVMLASAWTRHGQTVRAAPALMSNAGPGSRPASGHALAVGPRTFLHPGFDGSRPGGDCGGRSPQFAFVVRAVTPMLTLPVHEHRAVVHRHVLHRRARRVARLHPDDDVVAR